MRTGVGAECARVELSGPLGALGLELNKEKLVTRTAFAIAAATALLILPACEQEGYVPDERVEGEGVGPGESEAGEEAALGAGEGGAEDEVDVGGGASGEIPTEGGGLTED